MKMISARSVATAIVVAIVGCGGEVESGPFCGDGLMNQPTEECDDGNAATNDACVECKWRGPAAEKPTVAAR